jgi:hypothetical protein
MMGSARGAPEGMLVLEDKSKDENEDGLRSRAPEDDY